MLQQDQVDSVEYYALQATEHVGSGGTQLLKGTVSRTKARKVSSATLPTVVPVPIAVYTTGASLLQKKLGLIVCLAAGFGIVLLVLVLT